MANKKKLITELYVETLEELTNDEENWLSFIKCASMNYKYNFNDQVLIYAQKPNAIACADIETWNRSLDRWVNKGSKGIALIVEEKGYSRLKYIFDVSDTNNRYGKEVSLWRINPKYNIEVIESLENKYGELENKNSIIETIISASSNVVQDNIQDYINQLNRELIERITEKNIQEFLSNSVAYIILNRCGYTTEEHLSSTDFGMIKQVDDIVNTIVLGNATSDISEMVLSDIYKTLKNIRINEINKIRTFENVDKTLYDIDKGKEAERSGDNDNLYQTRGLRDSEPRITNSGGEETRKIRNNEIELSEREQKSVLPNFIDEESINRTFDGDRREHESSNGRDNQEFSNQRGSDRGTKSNRSDEVDRTDEQYKINSDRDSQSRTNLQLELLPTEEEQKQIIAGANNASVFHFPHEAIDYILQNGSGFEKGKYRIFRQIQSSLSTKENIDFLKNEYGTGGSSNAFGEIGQDHNSKGITLHIGYEENRPELFLPWNNVEKRLQYLIKNDRYLNSYEKENYKVWLEEESINRELNTKTDELVEKVEQDEIVIEPKKYQYYLGAKVYIGIEEYEIQSFDDETVRCYDYQYPLFSKEFSREEFDKRVKENPANDHLIIKEEQETTQDYEFEIVTPLNQLNDNDFFTVARIIDLDNCVELHYNAGNATVEFGTKISLDEWEDYIEDIDWFNKDTSKNLMLEKLEYLFRDFKGYDVSKIQDIQINSDENKTINSDDKLEQYIGKTITVNDRKYFVENITSRNDEIELRDVTFEGQVGLPITRIDRLSKMMKYLENENEDIIIPTFEKKVNSKIKTFDIHPEIKDKDRSNFIITNDELGYGSPRDKFKNNIDAIKVLKKCEIENRFATLDEQEVLSKYVGWGGLSQCFDLNNSSWATEYLELKNILSEDEYKNARESTLTAFYTPPVVIRTMYKALENIGLKSGNILEPSCGVGNFLGMLPDSLKNCKMYGIELDSISGRIARQLYQKSSIAVDGYENTNLPDSFFDIVVGNVPFGDFKVLDKKYDKHKFLIHDYFFAKTIDKVRPGGIIAFITSKGTLDKETPTFRRYLAQRADLLGAIRLPNNTFKNNAGTEVTADIIFLQKRDSIMDIEPDWVYLDTNENGIKMNKYFIDNPEMILGNMEIRSTQYGFDSTCEPIEESTLEQLLDESINNIHAEIKDYLIEDIGEEEDLSIPADLTVRNFSYTLVNNQLYFRENSKMYPKELPLTTTNRIKNLIEIRDSVRSIIELQTEDYPDIDIKREQAKLNELYDNFNKKYGLINSRANSTFSDDSSYFLLCSLEVLNEKGELIRKADIFDKRTIKPQKQITSVDTANEALIVSIGEKAKVDMEFMCSLTNKSEKELCEELNNAIFKLPTYPGETLKYVTADEYLSGNVREKLKEALKFFETDSTFESNVKALQEVQPKDLSASEIAVRLGATWLPVEDVQEFMYELLECSNYVRWNVKVRYFDYTGEWNIEGKSYDRANVKANSTYGTNRVNAYKIIEETLNLKDVRIYDYIEDEEGKKQQILNKKETAIAQAKQEQIKMTFDEWIWKNPERRERLTKLYNELYNSIRPREYDGSHINFSGINQEITLRPHQLNAIARILYGNNTLLAHEVGAGKTWEMVAGAMESKRLGLCSKSLIVVPNHIIEQFAGEFLQLYPTANILVATKKDFETSNRKKFCSRISTGEFDAVIIGHSQFEKIPMSTPRQKKILEKQIEEITFGINDLKKNRGENFSIKQLEKTKKSIQNKLEKLNDQSRKDDVITFEELGVDKIFVDEAHYYKNLFLYTKMRNVGGIAQTEAQKSSDLFMKCRYLDEITGGKGIVFATGTPISNSMVELYTMQRYLQMYTLEKNKLQHFDSWASTFGETVTAIELAPEGTGYRAKTRFAKFYNLPELMNMFKEIADIQTQDMLNLPVPKANYENIVIKPSVIQEDMVKELADRAEKVRNKLVNSTTDNMLKITNDGRKLALDQRLLNDMLPDYEESKVVMCSNNIYKIWNENKQDKLTQLVFCDLSTPKADGIFNVYSDLKNKLLDRGIPDDEIAFIHEADTEVRKKELFAKVRKGQIRVLIGSTQKMGAGTNCQDKLIALHDLDCPWRPSDLTQRSGRIIRQGNKNKEVFIYRYVTEKTFDAYLYQLVENKQRFISQIMTSKCPVRSAEDIDETALSYAEIKALAAGNPLIIEKTDLDTKVSKLRLLKQSHLSQIYAIEDKVIKYYPAETKRLELRILNLKEDIEQFNNNDFKTEEKFQKMIINNITYTDKTEAGNKILEACKNMTSPEPILLGEYKGFKMELSFDSSSREFNINLKNKLSHNVKLGSDVHGNITRLDNTLIGLKEKLNTNIIMLEDTKKQYENAKKEIERTFPQEEELKSKSKRLDELNIILNLNEKDKELIDSGLDESDASQIYKKDKER